jgi:glycosyltransferase involved in cell wall biosynthesis
MAGNMEALVTVIIPVYNCSTFVPYALQSIMDQTYKNWECIIVNDGSTDDLIDVVSPYLKLHKNIIYIEQTNRGLSAARNAGLSKARGTYIQFLDADDLIDSGKLEIQVKILEENRNVGVCYSNFRAFDSSTGRLLDRYATKTLGDNPLEDFLFSWERGLSIPVHCALFRKEIWENEKAFNESLKAKEDWLMWVSLSLKKVDFNFVNKDLALYRFHDFNMCRNYLEMMTSFLQATCYISEIIPVRYKEKFISEAAAYAIAYYGKNEERKKLLPDVYNSYTWRIGRLATSPVRMAAKAIRLFRKKNASVYKTGSCP